ncbi:MAG: pilin [Candidatus Doudnabacteria bacterium]
MKLSKINFLKVGEVILALTLVLAPVAYSFAASTIYQPDCSSLGGVRCDSSNTGINDIIIKVLNILLGVAFLVAVLFLVIGGFRYITSAGNEEVAGKGRATIINALIGVVVIILSYVIVQVVARTVTTTGNTTGSQTPT